MGLFEWLTGNKGGREKAAGYRSVLLPTLSELDHGLDGIVISADLDSKIRDVAGLVDLFVTAEVPFERRNTELVQVVEHLWRLEDCLIQLEGLKPRALIPLMPVHRNLVALAREYLEGLTHGYVGLKLAVEKEQGTVLSEEVLAHRKKGFTQTVEFHQREAIKRSGQVTRVLARFSTELASMRHHDPEAYSALGVLDESWRWIGVMREWLALPGKDFRFPPPAGAG